MNNIQDDVVLKQRSVETHKINHPLHLLNNVYHQDQSISCRHRHIDGIQEMNYSQRHTDKCQ